MREEGAQPPAAAVGAALSILRAALQPSPLASGLSPPGLAEHNPGPPAAEHTPGDRESGGLPGPLTSRPNNSQVVGENEANAANYVCLSLRENRQE